MSTPVSVSEEGGAAAAADLSARLQRRHLVRSLASAVLQLEQGIDPKYLQAPLGEHRLKGGERGGGSRV